MTCGMCGMWHVYMTCGMMFMLDVMCCRIVRIFSLHDLQVLRFLAKLQTDIEPAIRTNTTYCLAKIAPHVGAASREKILIPGLSKTLRDPFPPARVVRI